MFEKLLKRYLTIPLITKLLFGFVLGSLLGSLAWYLDDQGVFASRSILPVYIAPFGTIFIQMLKMVVVPIVFFTLLLGAASLPLGRLGRVGAQLLLLYLITSFVAALVGVGIALVMNPGYGAAGQWQALTDLQMAGRIAKQAPLASPKLMEIIMSMFDNPFSSLSQSNFLGMIVFAILLGLALSRASEKNPDDHELVAGIETVRRALHAINTGLYVAVQWIMEYAPFGVLALSVVNFGLYGPAIVGPYLKVVGGIVIGIFIMTFVVYTLFIKFGARKDPIFFFKNIKEPMITAFVTRSSAAALPVSMNAAVNKLMLDKEIASFALPMGATINMDGVCVHLPMFAILAANLFQIPLGLTDLFVLVVSTVLAAIGTGGVPGGSIMLLFIVLGSLGLSEEQIALTISLALGVNPILDMFETMNNVTGDLMCTYLLGNKPAAESVALNL